MLSKSEKSLMSLNSMLLSTCASLYCSHAKQIREDFDELE